MNFSVKVLSLNPRDDESEKNENGAENLSAGKF